MASLSVRLRNDMIDRLDELAKSVRLTRSHIVRAALEYGLERFSEDPGLLLRPEHENGHADGQLDPFSRRLAEVVQRLVQDHREELIAGVVSEEAVYQ